MTRRARLALWSMIAAGVLVVVGANAHLLYLAVRSQPACVDHVRLGSGVASDGAFRAARSACTPTATARPS